MLNLVRKTDQIASTIDHIGKLQAAIRELEGKLKRSKQDLLTQMAEQGVTRADGVLYAATIVDKDVSRVSWRSVAAHFKPSRQLVTAHTTVQHQTYPLINARKV